MDLQTLAVLVAIASPLLVTGVAWGTFKARLAILERSHQDHEDRLRAIESRRPLQGSLL
jgi:hypothetical protein